MICDLLSALNQPACDRGPARISSLIEMLSPMVSALQLSFHVGTKP